MKTREGKDSLRPDTILVVSADSGKRRSLAEGLRRENLTVLEAGTSSDGWRQAEEQPDLILLDVTLPDGGGVDLCRRLKADPQTASALVLYLAATALPLHIASLVLAGGADGYLPAPLDPPLVAAQVKSWLRLRRAEEAARAAAQQWRATFDAVRDGICLVDQGGIILRCNQAMADLLHQPFGHIVGAAYADLMREVAGGSAPKLSALVQQTRRRETSEWPIGDRWYHISADPLLDEQGEVLATVHLFADITQRKHAEQALAQLAAIVESSDDAMVTVTPDGAVLSWNPGAERLFGYAAADMHGRSLAVLIPPDRTEELARSLEQVRRGERLVYYETVRRHKDGRELAVSVTAYPIRDASGEVVSASYTYRNVAERKHLEEQLRQAQKMEAIGQLAGGIAHDFNNLLTIILGYGQLVLSQVPPDNPLTGSMAEILKAADRAAALTGKLLAFSRRQVLEARVLDLNALVADMDKMLHRLIGEDIELATRLDPQLAPVLADPNQLDQVLLNLAVNARDAMPKGGRLTIETANVSLDEAYAATHAEVAPGPYVQLSVSDTGVGIPKELQPHLFEPFFTTKEVGKGTGLGLSTVYGIIKQSGGHIAVYSEPGHGTTFKLYLPPTSQTPAAPASSVPPASGSETVLVVEDEPVVRQLTCLTLEQYGYRVLEATDADDALRRAEQHGGPIHLLVTDVVMPQMSGRELASRLAALHPEARVLYISGYTNDAIVRHGIMTAEASFLSKPFDREALARKVREVLQSPARPGTS